MAKNYNKCFRFNHFGAVCKSIKCDSIEENFVHDKSIESVSVPNKDLCFVERIGGDSVEVIVLIPCYSMFPLKVTLYECK